MILPPNTRLAPRRRPIGLYPDRPDWHSFVLGACVLLGLAGLWLFTVGWFGS